MNSMQSPTDNLLKQSEPTPPPKPRRKPASQSGSNPTDRAMGIFFLILALFEILLIATVLLRLFPASNPPAGTDNGVNTGTSVIDPAQTDASPKAFSNGVIRAIPVDDASTVTPEGLYSKYAILVEAETGKVIAAHNADAVFSPASMTKVMTLIVACEQLTENDLNQKAKLTSEVQNYVRAGNYAGSEVALIDGDKYLNDEFLLRDLLYGIGMASDAASCVIVAGYVCPAPTPAESESKFVELMNQKAAQMGLTHTRFDNVIGYESEQNVTTAREMACIMQYAMQSDLIRRILGTNSYPFKGYYVDPESGADKTYNRFFYHSISERMETYKKRNDQKPFALAGTKLNATKTGSFGTSSFLALEAAANSNGTRYILITGDAAPTDIPPSTGSLRDVVKILDTYVK